MHKNILVFFKGFVMGISEIIPGVSGSTLALVMGIYSDFLSFLFQISNLLKEFLLLIFLKSNFKKLRSKFKEIDFTFGGYLLIGMVIAIASFSNLMHYLLEERKEYVLAFFFGLVIASVAVPWKEIKEKNFRQISLVVLSIVVFFILFSLRPYELTQLPHPLYFFFGGSVAICAMVLPGISGSFVFLMLGLYELIMEHISNLTKLNVGTTELFNLFFLALGILFGFSIFVRILRNGLKNYSSIIFAILTGIMIASLRVLWPYSEVNNFTEIVYLSFTSCCGFGVVFFLRKLS